MRFTSKVFLDPDTVRFLLIFCQMSYWISPGSEDKEVEDEKAPDDTKGPSGDEFEDASSVDPLTTNLESDQTNKDGELNEQPDTEALETDQLAEKADPDTSAGECDNISADPHNQVWNFM